jgi:putative salt-induced outer membrane protein
MNVLATLRRRARRVGAWPLALVALAGAPSAAQTPPDSGLRTAEERLAQALVTRDAAIFDELLDPRFVLRGTPDVDRATWIANALKFCWGDRADITDFRVVEAQGDRAIAALVLTTTRDPVTCERAIVRSVITDVWQRDDGRWRLVLRHSGPAGGVEAQFVRAAAPPPLWEGSAELSLVDTGGNTETQTLGASGTVMWRPGRWTSDFRTQFIRSVTEDVVTARTFSAALRQARTVSERIDAFARIEYLANEFAGVDHRVSADAGIGYKVLTGPAHTLRTDAGLGYSREARLDADDLSFALTTLGAAYTWRVSRGVSLTNNALLTASLHRGEDWRFRNALAVATSLTRRLAVKLSHELTFLNAPAAGFEGRDTVLAIALALRF